MNHQHVNLTCQDSYILSGYYFPAKIQTTHLPIVIASATGILQRFYQPFALWLQQQG